MGSIRLAFRGFAGGPCVEAPEGLGSAAQQVLLAVLRSLAGVSHPGQQQVLQAPQELPLLLLPLWGGGRGGRGLLFWRERQSAILSPGRHEGAFIFTEMQMS